jgi:hypothetical protein
MPLPLHFLQVYGDLSFICFISQYQHLTCHITSDNFTLSLSKYHLYNNDT